MQVVFNQQFLPAAEAKTGVTEPGVLYGEGCFETLRLHDGQPRFFAQHWARLSAGAQALGLPLPIGENDANAFLVQLATKNGVEAGVGRISLHQTQTGADLLIQASPPRQANPPDSFRVAISDWPHPGPSPHSVIKHNNYAHLLAAHRQARTQGWDECLLTNHQGELVEGAVSNLFWVDDDGRLATPPLSSGALPGVIRALVIALFPAIIERAPYRDQLARAPEIFLTNSLFEIMPVREFAGQSLPNCPGSLTSRVRSCFADTYPL